MPVTLEMRPDLAPMTKDEFIHFAPPFSIAIDGFVSEGPWREPKGPYRNFNHHEGVDRIATRATCGQVLMSLRLGLFESFRDGSGPKAQVYANDCDEDVCLSWYLLSHGAFGEQVTNPRLNRLVFMADALDASAGAYPFPKDMPVLRELAWVFDPYRRFRLSGGLASRDPAMFRGVVEDVVQRIKAHVMGEGGAQDLDHRYERLDSCPGLVMVQEEGAQARTAMFADGIRAFISARQRADGAWTYSIGRMSEDIRLPCDSIYFLLNQEEGLDGNRDRWGGSTTIGGSPRIAGSKLPPAKVFEIVRDRLSWDQPRSAPA